LAENNPSEPNPSEKQTSNCPECERLWKAYALSTRKYLDATLAVKASAQRDDVEKKFLEAEALEAAQWRDLARKAIRDHAATHAGEKPEPQE
jgi:hypothetical protein